MKPTMWTHLDANTCHVIEVDERSGHIVSVKISHPVLRRALWFTESQRGNYYWRNTGKYGDAYADGYIIVGSLDGMASAPRAYPELA